MSPSRNALSGWMKPFADEEMKSLSAWPSFCWVWPHFTKALPEGKKTFIWGNWNPAGLTPARIELQLCKSKNQLSTETASVFQTKRSTRLFRAEYNDHFNVDDTEIDFPVVSSYLTENILWSVQLEMKAKWSETICVYILFPVRSKGNHKSQGKITVLFPGKGCRIQQAIGSFWERFSKYNRCTVCSFPSR